MITRKQPNNKSRARGFPAKFALKRNMAVETDHYRAVLRTFFWMLAGVNVSSPILMK